MTIDHYNRPNEWNSDAQTATGPQQPFGHPSTPCSRTDGVAPSAPPLLIARDTSDDESAIELRDTANEVEITTDLPECSLKDIDVSVSGTSVRIRAEPTVASPETTGIDRTITLAADVTNADIVATYDDPTLTVTIPHEHQ